MFISVQMLGCGLTFSLVCKEFALVRDFALGLTYLIACFVKICFVACHSYLKIRAKDIGTAWLGSDSLRV